MDFFGRWIGLEQGATKSDEPRKVKMTAEVFVPMKACSVGKDDDEFIFTREDGTHVCDPRDGWYTLCVSSKLGEYVGFSPAI